MNIELTNLGIQSKVQDYTVTKKLDDFGVVTEIDSKAKFDSDNGFELLVTETMSGSTEEDALFTIECGDDDIEIDGMVLHNEGSFNFNHCYAEKSLKFRSPIECIKNKDINIFDYVPYSTQTIQGDLERQNYANQVFYYIGDDNVDFPTIDQLISILGGIPDYSAAGLFPEYISIIATPLSELVDNGQGGFDDQYTHHSIDIYISYIGFFSDTQINEYWRPHPISGFYYTQVPTIIWDVPYFNSYQLGQSYYIHFANSAGQYNKYTDIPISNTFSINEIIRDIFDCTDIQIVSNFFGIDDDFTHADNNEYSFATSFLQDLRIAQSFDIIRESAIQDSFGQSGLIKAKTFVLEFNKIFGLMLVYDSTFDVIRWEHYTYFESKGIDFEVKELEYELDDNTEINRELINTETWFFAQPSPTDGFYTTKIDYQNSQLNSTINDKATKSDTFMTDLFGTLNNEKYNTDAYKKLFFLLSTDGTSVNGLNSIMSIRSLVENLHYKNRVLPNGLHDDRVVTFTGYSVGLETKVSFFNNFKLFNKLNPGNTVYLNRAGTGTWLISEMSISDQKIELTVKK